jgi:hypothetical protein
VTAKNVTEGAALALWRSPSSRYALLPSEDPEEGFAARLLGLRIFRRGGRDADL